MPKFHEDGELGGCFKGEPDNGSHVPALWEWVIRETGARSMLDLGCGEGHQVEWFCNARLSAWGVDGCLEAIENSPVVEQLRFHDFRSPEPFSIGQVDLVWSCEFVEHVAEEYVPNILKTLRLCQPKWILLTHGLPGQPGYHHVNCQPPEYWIAKLKTIGYRYDAALTARGREIIGPADPHKYFLRSGMIFVNGKPQSKEEKP